MTFGCMTLGNMAMTWDSTYEWGTWDSASSNAFSSAPSAST